MTKDPEEKVWCLKPSTSVQQTLAEIPEDEPIDQFFDKEEEAVDADNISWEGDQFANIPEPPDGGWGWVVVAASFLCNMVVDGIAYTFGIFFMEFVHYYQEPKGKTAWVGSLLSGCYLSAGPLVSALTNRFGCRLVTIVGSILSAIAFLLSTIAPNVDILMLTYGIMGGIGFGLIYLPAIVSVSYYFSTKRALATGIAVCGSGMGAFVFAPLCQALLDIYDWKGALFILAGLSLNCMVFGALMRPLEVPGPPETKPLLQRMAEEKELLRLDSLGNSQFLLIQNADGSVEKTPKLFINTEPGVHSTLHLDQLFGKSPADTPVITLSPIEEVRISPANSREEDDINREIVEQDGGGGGEGHDDDEDEKPAFDFDFGTQEQLSQPTSAILIPNGHAQQYIPPSAIQAIAKRKGLIPVNGALKMCLSNITVTNTSRKNSINNATMSSMTLSSSGMLYSNSRNNNYLVEDVWQLPLDGHKRSYKKIDRKDCNRPLYRKDIFYSGSIVNLPEYKQSNNDVRSYVASVISIPRDTTANVMTSTVDGKTKKDFCPPCFHIPKSMLDTLSEMLDFSLLKDPTFLLICISNIFGMMGFYIPFVYVTDSAIMKGVPPDRAAFLISIIGITNTIGRLLFGWLSDRPGVSSLLVNNVCLTLSGLCTFLIPFCDSYYAIIADCILFGLFISAYICLTSIILVELLGLEKLTNAYGLLSLFRGASSIVGPPIAGSIYDSTGSYDLPFFISGILLVISALMTFLVPCVKRYADRSQKPPPTQHPQANGAQEATMNGDLLTDNYPVDQVETVV